MYFNRELSVTSDLGFILPVYIHGDKNTELDMDEVVLHALPLNLILDMYRESKIRQQLLLQVVS